VLIVEESGCLQDKVYLKREVLYAETRSVFLYAFFQVILRFLSNSDSIFLFQLFILYDYGACCDLNLITTGFV
jgi:hypothetical protein